MRADFVGEFNFQENQLEKLLRENFGVVNGKIL